MTTSDLTRRTTSLAGVDLHHVSAGASGSTILLVHGFPETSQVFERLMPLLAQRHRVVAVDLPGFGGSGHAADGDDSSSAAAEALHALIAELDLGPVHLSGQDIGGDTVYRLAATHPEDVRSLTAIEMGLSGFGLEAMADVAHGGAWHVGVLATPGAAEFVFTGRERQFLAEHWFPLMTRVAGAVTDADLDALAQAYSRPDAWQGPLGLYGSALREGEELQALAATPLTIPVLAVDAMNAPFTAQTMTAVASDVRPVVLDGVGHHPALEAPERLAETMLAFAGDVEG